MLSSNQIQSYLEIVSQKSPQLSLSCLKGLQSGHLANFCFSSLGVLLNKDLPLDSEPLFDRLVTKRRGGYCFEHNRIFFEVLKYLGFSCELSLARVLLNRDIDVPRTHRITRVSLDGNQYLADVGFGPQCPREPLLIETEEPQQLGEEIYRVIHPHSGHYFLQIFQEGGWFTLYSFDKGSYTDADCLCGHHYSSTYPGAAFVNNLVMSLKSSDTLCCIRNGEFQRRTGGETVTTHITSGDQLAAIILEEFAIELSPDEAEVVYLKCCE